MTTQTVDQLRLPIAGGWFEPSDGRYVEVTNPTTEEPIARSALAGPADVDRAVRAARAAFDAGPWPSSSVFDRAAVMIRAGELIAERAELLAHTITLEVGSPLAIAQWQPAAAQLYLDYYAGQSVSFAWEQEREGIRSQLLVRHQPVGVVGAIVPWNFPLALTFPKLAPALLTGCTVVLKPPEETPLFGFLLAEIFEEAGLPPGVLSVVPADRTVSEELVRHPLVDKISFTGSTRAGRRIGALCGEQIKRCSLELGGKSAAIVLPGADLGTVLPGLAPNTMRNNGQTCTNQTRVLVHRDQYADAVEALREALDAFELGDPADPEVFIGPVISDLQRARVEGYIAQGQAEGARLVLGGGRPNRERGYFVAPTLFADVDNRMTIAQEEIFGPVVCAIPYKDEAHAVALANDSPYGLSGSVWGPDAEHAKAVARRIRSGNVAVNQHTLDPAGPFGGFKQSGLGRENGVEGIEAYTELQTIPYQR